MESYKSYNFCGRKGGCCPTLKDNRDGTWTITDDSGGKVILTTQELKQLQALKIYEDGKVEIFDKQEELNPEKGKGNAT